jgi:hypothetical protein
LLEQAIIAILRDDVLTPANVRRLRGEVIEASLLGTDEPNPAERQLRELRRKIEGGAANLLLAESTDDYRAMSKMLAKWRDQADKLARGLKRDVDYEANRSDVAMAVGELGRIADHLHLCDRYKLAALVQSVVQRVVIGSRMVGEGRARHQQLYGFVEFDHDVWDGGTIELDDADLRLPSWRTWHAVAEYVSQQRRAVRVGEVCQQFDIGVSVACDRLARAVAAGRLKHLGKKRGYIVADSDTRTS